MEVVEIDGKKKNRNDGSVTHHLIPIELFLKTIAQNEMGNS